MLRSKMFKAVLDVLNGEVSGVTDEMRGFIKAEMTRAKKEEDKREEARMIRQQVNGELAVNLLAWLEEEEQARPGVIAAAFDISVQKLTFIASPLIQQGAIKVERDKNGRNPVYIFNKGANRVEGDVEIVE